MRESPNFFLKIQMANSLGFVGSIDPIVQLHFRRAKTAVGEEKDRERHPLVQQHLKNLYFVPDPMLSHEVSNVSGHKESPIL